MKNQKKQKTISQEEVIKLIIEKHFKKKNMKTIKNTILNHILRSVQRNIEVIDEYLMSNIDNYRSEDQDSIVRLLFDTKNNIDCLNSLLNKGRKINKGKEV